MHAVTKQQARSIIQKQLDAITSDEYLLAADDARNNLADLLSQLTSQCSPLLILRYESNQKWREVDVSSLELELNTVQFDRVPPHATAVFPGTPYDIILIPLYGFSDTGYRLGHGAGWYDRFLVAQPQALKIGVGLEANRLDFAVDQHDIVMDIIVTEKRLLFPL